MYDTYEHSMCTYIITMERINTIRIINIYMIIELLTNTFTIMYRGWVLVHTNTPTIHMCT